MIHSFNAMYMYRVFLLTLHVLLLGISCDAKNSHLCPVSSCGEVRNISYPFRLKGDPKYCGHPEFELTCEYDHTVLYLFDGRYYVKSIVYYFYLDEEDFHGFITVVDDGLQKGNCSSLPRYSLGHSNFSNTIIPYYPLDSLSERVTVAFVKCLQPIAFTRYFDTKPCIEGTHSADMPPNSSQMEVYSYALPGYYLAAGDIKDSCTITMMSFASDYGGREEDQYNRASAPYKDLHNQMAGGFNLTYWGLLSAERSFRFCFLGSRYQRNGCSHYHVRHFLAAKFTLGAPFALIFLIYKWRRRHLAMDENIEEFLQAHNNFMPVRYSYSDIKKITRNFKHKLGEGGYGSVYKGILRSGNEVAVKILNKPKSNGQDFISEVGTIGRIHHVNVVQLVGFCFNKSKQALVYDYMSNGSLDKHIFSKDGYYSIDYKRIYEISLGVAKGIEYLHRGCDMQILHFDIKPHNILLDQNFTPKVSDFGLAKLYPTNHNMVSLTVVRGTLGYMAPELFYKDIGGVSYKVDVYSFGMLLMEMAGRRRNVNAKADRSSQIYFPLWVYDQLHEENEIEMEVVQEEREIIRKMVIVALWCIQLIPNDRPSMTKVLDMLEGDINKLQLPPKPLLYPSDEPVDNVYTGIELESCSISSSTPTIF
ncbi:rust resistance kinase Lr10 [Eucalyptus grandis]|uniref:rust resistance kinase Lr10 n=1 Tax=Eucalyptus grandis TaxID=71139 RepID=UPI00192ED7DB|nr:rust resistance kinase Lr10 [Eucalyptus grandis]